ncbi:metal-dependent hydrolase [Variovorax paradoxus]|uniref:Metal-dependent hydrolase n=1 Tax=Variovorax paradoxus TaxID=34073 RepID=A0A0D0LYX8_VARPD|nr:YgjP-like metallopeptidase domain-containing protein [Variovorax paradoxus]KIQ34558.1 metal-dependent hydrolase [Variovorax paradoxus]
MKYLAGYPAGLQEQVSQLIAQDKLAALLNQRYPSGTHDIQSDRALYDYVSGLKNDFMRKAEPLAKVMFDNKLHVIRNALGTHTTVSRVQGGKLKAKREIRVASLFKEVPLDLLRMIVVHELAHMKEKAHDKAFYALCTYMEPDYHRFEFDLRLYLTHLDLGGKRLWSHEASLTPP